MATMIESPLAHLTDAEIDELAREFDAIHEQVFAETGRRHGDRPQRDARPVGLDARPVHSSIAPMVKEICERYRLPYNTGPFLKQLGMVQRTILRLAFPGGRPRPKPGPNRGVPNNGGHSQPSTGRRVARPTETERGVRRALDTKFAGRWTARLD
jgi:hypothetical protein